LKCYPQSEYGFILILFADVKQIFIFFYQP